MKKLLFTSMAFFSITVLFAQPPAGEAKVGEVYGENITIGKTVSAKKLSKQLKLGATLETKVAGKVLEVCANKGCWIKLQLDNKRVATVKMKDYSFFVPAALNGKMVLVEGKVEMQTTSAKELRHFAEDAKKSQEEIVGITEPKKEIKILANGIQVI